MGNEDFKWAMKDPESTARYVEAQPAPKNEAGSKPLWPMIIAETERRIGEMYCHDSGRNRDAEILRSIVDDMRARHEFGVAKYGVPLVAKNDRDHLVDAYQELLDGIVYLRAEIEKHGGIPTGAFAEASLGNLVRLYQRTYENAVELRAIIAERDGQ